MRSTFVSLCALFAASASASIPYFNITNAEFTDAYDLNSPGGYQRFGFTILDPNTGNSTYCYLAFSFVGDTPTPATWNFCSDKTFSFKMDNADYNNPVVELKHQYRGVGKACVKSNGPQCTTARGYLQLLESQITGSFGDGMNDEQTWAGPYEAPIFSACGGGCGLTSGKY